MFKKFPSDKINGTKNDLFFLSRAPTHHSFIFSSRLLCALKHKVRLSKSLCKIFYFWFPFVFTKVYIFVQKKYMDSLTLNVIISFKIIITDFFYQGFLSQALTIHRTAGEGRGPSFTPLYHFHPLTNIETFICNFACEMTITYF